MSIRSLVHTRGSQGTPNPLSVAEDQQLMRLPLMNPTTRPIPDDLRRHWTDVLITGLVMLPHVPTLAALDTWMETVRPNNTFTPP